MGIGVRTLSVMNGFKTPSKIRIAMMDYSTSIIDYVRAGSSLERVPLHQFTRLGNHHFAGRS